MCVLGIRHDVPRLHSLPNILASLTKGNGSVPTMGAAQQTEELRHRQERDELCIELERLTPLPISHEHIDSRGATY